jgi:uncharacterized protein YunC (DUF1805 family)/5S rRNA maturation endonuclease (ribonuclease M5)
VDTVIVEGPRDVAALRRLGYKERLDVCSRVLVSDADLVESIAKEVSSVVILTDFDEEGRKLNRSFKALMERRGIKVESGLRRQFGRMTAALGVYAIENLDNVAEKVRTDDLTGSLLNSIGRLNVGANMFKVEKVALGGSSFLGLKVDLGDIPPLLLLKGDKGFVMCGYLNIESAEKAGAIATVVSGVNSFEDILNAKIKASTGKARALGLEPGKVVRDVINALN